MVIEPLPCIPFRRFKRQRGNAQSARTLHPAEGQKERGVSPIAAVRLQEHSGFERGLLMARKGCVMVLTVQAKVL